MTEEHYQDGIKLPTDEDEPKWERYNNTIERVKVTGGYLYKVAHNLGICFVPDNSTDNQEIPEKISALTTKLNQMQNGLSGINMLWQMVNSLTGKLEKLESLLTPPYPKPMWHAWAQPICNHAQTPEHPRDEVKLCMHAIPFRQCTICY